MHRIATVLCCLLFPKLLHSAPLIDRLDKQDPDYFSINRDQNGNIVYMGEDNANVFLNDLPKICTQEMTEYQCEVAIYKEKQLIRKRRVLAVTHGSETSKQEGQAQIEKIMKHGKITIDDSIQVGFEIESLHRPIINFHH